MCVPHLSARLKVRVRKRARSFQKLLHMIPTPFPVTPNVSVSSICSHAEQKSHQQTLSPQMSSNTNVNKDFLKIAPYQTHQQQ